MRALLRALLGCIDASTALPREASRPVTGMLRSEGANARETCVDVRLVMIRMLDRRGDAHATSLRDSCDVIDDEATCPTRHIRLPSSALAHVARVTKARHLIGRRVLRIRCRSLASARRFLQDIVSLVAAPYNL